MCTHHYSFVNRMILKNIIILIVLQQLIFPGQVQAQSELDPVVISSSDTQITRRQFELEFELAMVMKALETGVPIKNQDQIYVMEHRFLEQRAREMVFLKVAKHRGIMITEKELDGVVNEYMLNLGFSEYSEKDLRILGFEDDDQLREILRRKLTISTLISDIRNELNTEDSQSAVNNILEDYYKQSGVELFPEKIDRPYLK
jgi:hypothetical protein